MQLGVEFVDLSAIDLDPELSRVISKNVARQYNVVPVRTSPDEVCLAMSDPLNFMAIEAVKNATPEARHPMVTTHDSLMRAIMTLYGNEGAARAIEEMKRDARTTGADDASTGSFQTSTLGDDADAQSAPTVRREQHHRASRHRARQRYPPGAARDRPACAHAYRRRAAHDPHGAEGAAGFRSSRV